MWSSSDNTVLFQKPQNPLQALFAFLYNYYYLYLDLNQQLYQIYVILIIDTKIYVPV